MNLLLLPQYHGLACTVLIEHMSAATNHCFLAQVVVNKYLQANHFKTLSSVKTCDLGSSKKYPSVGEGTITAPTTLLVVASTLANAGTIPTDDV